MDSDVHDRADFSVAGGIRRAQQVNSPLTHGTTASRVDLFLLNRRHRQSPGWHHPRQPAESSQRSGLDEHAAALTLDSRCLGFLGAPLPGPTSFDLDNNRPAQKGPHHHQYAECLKVNEARFQRRGAYDVRRDENLEAQEHGASERAAKTLIMLQCELAPTY